MNAVMDLRYFRPFRCCKCCNLQYSQLRESPEAIERGGPSHKNKHPKQVSTSFVLQGGESSVVKRLVPLPDAAFSACSQHEATHLTATGIIGVRDAVGSESSTWSMVASSCLLLVCAQEGELTLLKRVPVADTISKTASIVPVSASVGRIVIDSEFLLRGTFCGSKI